MFNKLFGEQKPEISAEQADELANQIAKSLYDTMVSFNEEQSFEDEVELLMPLDETAFEDFRSAIVSAIGQNYVIVARTSGQGGLRKPQISPIDWDQGQLGNASTTNNQPILDES